MTNRYTFGFPTSIKGISFPGRPRIITAEVNGVTVNPGNYSYNGETFTFSAQKPVGPNKQRVGSRDCGRIGPSYV